VLGVDDCFWLDNNTVFRAQKKSEREAQSDFKSLLNVMKNSMVKTSSDVIGYIYFYFFLIFFAFAIQKEY